MRGVVTSSFRHSELGPDRVFHPSQAARRVFSQMGRGPAFGRRAGPVPMLTLRSESFRLFTRVTSVDALTILHDAAATPTIQTAGRKSRGRRRLRPESAGPHTSTNPGR